MWNALYKEIFFIDLLSKMSKINVEYIKYPKVTQNFLKFLNGFLKE